MAVIGQLRVSVDAVKSSVNSTMSYIQNEAKKTGDSIEKSFGEAGSKGMKNLKKEAENTINTIGKLNDKLGNLKADLNSEIIGGKKFKELQKEINKTEKELQKATGGTQNFGSSLKSIGGVVAGVFAVDKILEFGKAVFSLTSQNQQLYNSFVTLTGSEEMAKNMLAQIQSLADQSPFEKLDLANQTKKLMGFGFEGQNAINIMQVLGNTTSALGGGKDVMDGLVLALGQIQAKGKLSAEELNQFAERGVPALAILTEKLGLTKDQIANIGQEGIEASKAIPALLLGLQEKYLGSLEKQSQTLEGRLSTITDTAKNKLAEFGDDVIGTQNKILDGTADMVNNDLPIILDGVSTTINSITNLGASVVGVIDEGFNSLTGNIQDSSKKQIGLFGYLSAGVGALGLVFSVLADIVSGVFKILVEHFKDGLANFKVFGQNISTLFQNLGINMGKAFDNLPGTLTLALKKSLQAVGSFINSVTLGLGGIVSDKLGLGKIVDNLDFGTKKVDFIDLNSGFKELPGFVNTSNASISALSDVLTNADNNFKKFADGIDNYGKVKEKAFKLDTLDGLGKSINEKRKELKSLTIGSEEYITKQKEINDLEKKFKNSIYKDELKNGGGKPTDSTKKAIDEEKKLKDEAIKKEIEQKEKYNKYLESLDEEKQKKIKQRLDLLKQSYKNATDIIDKQIDKAKDNIKKLDEEIKKSLENIDNLTEKSNELDKEKGLTLGERNIAIIEREKEIQKELNNLKEKGVSLDLAKSIGMGTLDVLQGSSTINGTTIDDLKNVLKLSQELQSLNSEQSLIKEQKDSGTFIAEADRVSKLNPTQKYLEEFAIKQKVIQDDLIIEQNKLINLEINKTNENQILDKFTQMKTNLDEQYKTKSFDIEKQISGNLRDEIDKRLIEVQRFETQAIASANRIRNAQGLGNSNNTKGFAEGGYTGDGGKYDVAGVVHKGEYVVPQNVLNSIPSLMPQLENIRLGGSNAINNTYNTTKSINVPNINVSSQMDVELFLEKLNFRL